MLLSTTSFLILSLVLLASGHPFGGSKGGYRVVQVPQDKIGEGNSITKDGKTYPLEGFGSDGRGCRRKKYPFVDDDSEGSGDGCEDDESSDESSGDGWNMDENYSDEEVGSKGGGELDWGIRPWTPNESTDLGSNVTPLGAEGKTDTSWKQSIASSWNLLKENTRDRAATLRQKMQQTLQALHEKSRQLLTHFQTAFARFGAEIQRGGSYVMRKFYETFGEIKGAERIARLKQRLEHGDETVRDFFWTVGQKVHSWINQNVKPIFRRGSSEDTEQVSKSNLHDIFKEPEFRKQLDRMVASGNLDEADAIKLSKSKFENHEMDQDLHQESPHAMTKGSHSSKRDTGSFGIKDPGLGHERSPSPYMNGGEETHHTTKKELIQLTPR